MIHHTEGLLASEPWQVDLNRGARLPRNYATSISERLQANGSGMSRWFDPSPSAVRRRFTEYLPIGDFAVFGR